MTQNRTPEGPATWAWLRHFVLYETGRMRWAMAGIVALCSVVAGLGLLVASEAPPGPLVGLFYLGCCLALGGGASGFLLAGWTGHPDLGGWALAAFAAYLATIVGTAIAGVLLFPPVGAFLAVVAARIPLFLAPDSVVALAGGLWWICFIAAQLMAQVVRRNFGVPSPNQAAPAARGAAAPPRSRR